MSMFVISGKDNAAENITSTDAFTQESELKLCADGILKNLQIKSSVSTWAISLRPDLQLPVAAGFEKTVHVKCFLCHENTLTSWNPCKLNLHSLRLMTDSFESTVGVTDEKIKYKKMVHRKKNVQKKIFKSGESRRETVSCQYSHNSYTWRSANAVKLDAHNG